MRRGRASRTAVMVANGRALADAGVTHVRDFHDPTARAFLPPKALTHLLDLERRIKSGDRGAVVQFALVRADLMALRTSVIDAAVRDAVRGGNTQIVILGAGLDGRAWRMPELAGVRVFEVDHPDTQAVKRAHLDRLPPAIADVRFVQVDFTRDSLDAELARAGHDAARPTCWIWEGVVMYLTPPTMRATLAQIAAKSAAGSTLIVNYHTTFRSRTFRLILRLIGEPVKGYWTPAEMAADLNAAGFHVAEDTGIGDWAARFATGDVATQHGHFMRVVVART